MNPDSIYTSPLAGLTILDLTTALAGPFATLLLAGLGARVIKIENPSNPDSCRTNAPYLGVGAVGCAAQEAERERLMQELAL